MNKLIKQSFFCTTGVISFVFTIVPEAIIGRYVLYDKISYETNILLNRILASLLVFTIVFLLDWLINSLRRTLLIKGRNYSIKVQYGDIFNIQDCLKIIPFDECYTNIIGDSPQEINSNSICGQYLKRYPIDDMQSIINAAGLKSRNSGSKYKNQVRYESGCIIPRDDYLLMAFTKLDTDGLGRMSYDEFIDCLFYLWKEIDKYHNGKSVCIPILGSGVTRIDDKSLTQQELLDIIIASYKMSPHKINQLRIVCKENDGFELKSIGNYI